MRVDATCLDEVWPLTAEFGTLVCHPTQAVTFAGGGGVYAVNGQAMTIDGVEEIDPIWRDNPHVSGAKINIKPLIDLGLSLCS